jgi:hypothetical protein
MPKSRSTSFQSSNARRVSYFGAENPGGAFGRPVGATLPCAATQRVAVS